MAWKLLSDSVTLQRGENRTLTGRVEYDRKLNALKIVNTETLEAEILTVDLLTSGYVARPGEVFVRNYSENTGLPAALSAAGLGHTIEVVKVGPFASEVHRMVINDSFDHASDVLTPVLMEAATPDDQGRVAFNDDQGDTVFSLQVSRVGEGYQIVVGEPHTVPLDFDTTAARHQREQAMQTLRIGLTSLADRHDRHIEFDAEGDPGIFATGHFILSQANGHDHFSITFTFPGEDTDHVDSVPTGWRYSAWKVVDTGDGPKWVSTAENAGDMYHTSDVLNAARAWVADYTPRASHSTPQPPQMPTNQPHIGK